MFKKKQASLRPTKKNFPQKDVFSYDDDIYYKQSVPNKQFYYKTGKEIKGEQSNKHLIRIAYINTALYWLIRLAIAAAIVYKILYCMDINHVEKIIFLAKQVL